MRPPHEVLNEAIGKTFGRWGKYVGENPTRVLLISTSLATLCLLGLINVRVELRNDEVFPPSGSWSKV
jgi:hypothetical protein